MSGFENSLLPEDSQLARRVKLFLASQPRASLRYLEIEAKGSTVTLRGLVTTYYERQLALQASRGVAGVRLLVDQITVRELVPQSRLENAPEALAREHPAAAV